MRPVIAVFVALLLVTPVVVSAGVNRWTPTGVPEGSAVHSLAFDPGDARIVYAGTRTGVYKSSDGARTWTAASAGLAIEGTEFLPGITALSSGSNPPVLYAGGGNRVFRTIDGARSWTASTLPFSGGGLFSLAVDPSNSMIVYAGGDGALFKSLDGGTRWMTSNSGIGCLAFYSIAIDPSAPLTLYTGTCNGVFKSMDGAATWTAANMGMIGCCAATMAIDPVTTSTLYAATDGGVFKSTNGASTWSPSSNGLILNFAPRVNALTIDPSDPATLYAAAGGGVFKSVNGAGRWNVINTGLPSSVEARVVAVDPLASSRLFSGTLSGVYRSEDSGRGWSSANAGLPGGQVLALVTSAAPPETVYAVGPPGLMKRFAAGAWTTARISGLSDELPAALAIDPFLSTTVYAATTLGVFKSVDGGINWTRTVLPGSPPIDALAIAPSNTAIIYASSSRFGHFFKSTDGGVSFAFVGFRNAASIALDPVAAGTVYVTTSQGPFKSLDGGVTWNAINAGPGFVAALAISRTSPPILYALTASPANVYRSEDGGARWTSIGKGLPITFNAAPLSIAVSPSDSSIVFIGTERSGVYRTHDGGLTWSAMNAGLTTPFVTHIAVSAGGTLVYAGTYAGIFEFEIAGFTRRRAVAR